MALIRLTKATVFQTILCTKIHNERMASLWFYIYIYIKVSDPVIGPVWPRGWVEV